MGVVIEGVRMSGVGLFWSVVDDELYFVYHAVEGGYDARTIWVTGDSFAWVVSVGGVVWYEEIH